MRLLLSTAIVIALVAPACTQQKPSPELYPAPGHLIDIGRRKLHLYCTGNGTPTVVLMAGGGAFSIDWALVQPQLAESTRVCSYDRAGLGWSGPGPEDNVVEENVSDLHALLHASGEHGPYVLVGASIAGIYIQAYQRAFPADVAALVFTNGGNRIGFQVKDKVGLIWELTEAEIRSGYSDFFTSRQENLPLRGVPNASRHDEQHYPHHSSFRSHSCRSFSART
jgi:pimeloyl-ACP methyl ester carboxylesterase